MAIISGHIENTAFTNVTSPARFFSMNVDYRHAVLGQACIYVFRSSELCYQFKKYPDKKSVRNHIQPDVSKFLVKI